MIYDLLRSAKDEVPSGGKAPRASPDQAIEKSSAGRTQPVARASSRLVVPLSKDPTQKS